MIDPGDIAPNELSEILGRCLKDGEDFLLLLRAAESPGGGVRLRVILLATGVDEHTVSAALALLREAGLVVRVGGTPECEHLVAGDHVLLVRLAAGRHKPVAKPVPRALRDAVLQLRRSVAARRTTATLRS